MEPARTLARCVHWIQGMQTRTVLRSGAFLVTTNTLEADDTDLSTQRVWRDPAHPSGTGERAPIVRVQTIRVPSHPDWVRAGNPAYENLHWCDVCQGYEHPEMHTCTAKGPREEWY